MIILSNETERETYLSKLSPSPLFISACPPPTPFCGNKFQMMSHSCPYPFNSIFPHRRQGTPFKIKVRSCHFYVVPLRLDAEVPTISYSNIHDLLLCYLSDLISLTLLSSHRPLCFLPKCQAPG